jgi:hypothetical protein
MTFQIFENIDNYKIDNHLNIYFKQIGNNTLYLNNIEHPLFTSKVWLCYELVDNQIIVFERKDSQLSFISKEISFKTLFSESETASYYFLINFRDFVLVIWDGSFYNSLTKNDLPQEKKVFVNDEFKWSIKEWGFINFFDTLCLNVTNESIKDKIIYNQFSRLSFETGEKLWDFDIEQHRDKISSAYPDRVPLMTKTAPPK